MRLRSVLYGAFGVNVLLSLSHVAEYRWVQLSGVVPGIVLSGAGRVNSLHAIHVVASGRAV